LPDTEDRVVERVCALFDQAEHKLKEVEQLEGDLAIPVVNELRYAGHHVIRGLKSLLGSQARAEHFQEAEGHCKRAIYDAHEAMLLYLLNRIRLFQNDYRKTILSDVIPDYQARILHLRKAQQLIKKAKEEHSDHRGDYYDEIAPHVAVVKEAWEVFEDARDELNKKLEQANEEERRRTEERGRVERQDRATHRRWQVGTVVAVLALAAGVTTKACEPSGESGGSGIRERPVGADGGEPAPVR